MCEFNALGKSRRTRSIKLVANVFDLAGDGGVVWRELANPIFVACVLTGLFAYDDDLRDRLELHLREVAEEFFPNQQYLRVRVIEDVLHLRCCQPPIHGKGHTVDHRGSE